MAVTTDPRGMPHGFASLVGPGASYAGVDQGIDFTGSFDVYALGDAVITRVKRGGSGWPGEGAVLNYKILSGPKAGSYVYVAEDFAPRSDLKPGKTVRRGEAIGRATGSGKAPGIEVGWAQPTGVPLAPRPPARPADQHTPQGEDFRQYVATGSSGAGGGGGYFTDPFAPGSIFGNPFGPGGVASSDSAIPGVGAVISTGKFLGRLTDASYLLRGLQVIAGAVLVLVGVVLLTRQVALAADVPSPVDEAASRVNRIPLPGTGRDLYQR